MVENCSINIGDLRTPGFCENVTSGVRRMLYVPKMDIEAINAVIPEHPTELADYVEVGSPAMTQRAITLNPGCEFAEIYASKDMGELKYTAQGPANNRTFHVTIAIHHPGFRRKALAFFAIAANLEFVLLVQKTSGEWHLLGDLYRGATLADGAEATSGKTSADMNGVDFQFEYDCQLPRIMFEGWSPNDEVYGVEMFRTAWLLADENGDVLVDENDVPIEIPVL